MGSRLGGDKAASVAPAVLDGGVAILTVTSDRCASSALFLSRALFRPLGGLG